MISGSVTANSAMPWKTYLGVLSKVRSQLVVNGEVRCEHEEMTDVPGLEEVCDERSHETRFPNSGCQRKAKGRKITLKIRD
jgi:hypothetical protein